MSQPVMKVVHPGMMSVLQDSGRFGMAKLGLTTGGPSDKTAYDWLNRLLDDDTDNVVIEISFGGLQLQVLKHTEICVTGAETELLINEQIKPMWCTHKVAPGDMIRFGFSSCGIKSYLGVKGGFHVSEQFGSVSTVLRENIGGFDGKPLSKGQELNGDEFFPQLRKRLIQQDIPIYSQEVRLRVIPGFQQKMFSRLEQRRFFSGRYQVSKQWDRMGYRLQGPAIKCQTQSLLSEGITLGAIQIPPDGQPIILMQDRQTIGGYPKIGSVLSLDIDKLAQCGQGAKVYFEPISMDCAHNELHLAKSRFEKTRVLSENY